MGKPVVVKRTKHNNIPRIFKKVAERSERVGAGYGVERAMIYVPVDTGKLRYSIKVIDNDSFGSDVRYSGYVETGTWRTRAQPYMEPAARDVAEAMPKIIRKEFKRWAFK